MTEWGDFEWDDEPDSPINQPCIEVDITDPNVIGELLGPDGEPVAVLLDRPALPFGFQPPRRQPIPQATCRCPVPFSPHQ